MTGFDILWLFLLLSSFQPILEQRILTARRTHVLRTLERKSDSRAITLIHRREGFAFLGIPFGGYIDIDDSEAVIRAIELTADTVPIELIVHTPGGLVLAAEQIAAALMEHPAPVTVYVPHYAMSGGTLIAMAADRIVMSRSAVLGPVDPQIGDLPVVSILAAVRSKDINQVKDRTLILADMGRKAQQQVSTFVERLLSRHLPADQAHDVANSMSDGRWTHDFPIDVDLARSLGLPVSTDLPDEVRELMNLFPQPRGRRPSVEYIPLPYDRPAPSPDGAGERGRRRVPARPR
jgi:ClpP class serine protease